MSFEDWIFALHLLMAATLVGSLVMSWIVVVGLWSADAPGATLGLNRVGMVATATTGVGLVGSIAFGIWLAVLRDAFQLWDGWVLAAIALWIVATLLLVRAFAEHADPASNRGVKGLWLRALASLAIVLIVVDMIWKPGA
jgi:hypothetical protein